MGFCAARHRPHDRHVDGSAHHGPDGVLHWVELALAAPVVFIVGYPVLRAAFVALFHGNFNMDLLIALGTIASFATGIMKVSGMQVESFAMVGSMIMGFHLVGTYLEASAKGRASQAIRALIELGARSAHIIVDGQEVEVPIEQVDPGDVMVVRPGEKIPTGGPVEGEAIALTLKTKATWTSTRASCAARSCC